MTLSYEWAVWMDRHDDGPHRTGSREFCEDWISDFYAETPSARPGAFYLARRVVGPWEAA